MSGQARTSNPAARATTPLFQSTPSPLKPRAPFARRNHRGPSPPRAREGNGRTSSSSRRPARGFPDFCPRPSARATSIRRSIHLCFGASGLRSPTMRCRFGCARRPSPSPCPPRQSCKRPLTYQPQTPTSAHMASLFLHLQILHFRISLFADYLISGFFYLCICRFLHFLISAYLHFCTCIPCHRC